MSTLAGFFCLFVAWVVGSYVTGLIRPSDRERESRRARREELKAARRRCRLRFEELGR